MNRLCRFCIRPAFLPLLALMPQSVVAQLAVQPVMLNLNDGSATVNLTDMQGAHAKFRYAGTQIAGGTLLVPEENPLIVVPSSGTTPASVIVTVNPKVVALMPPGGTDILDVVFTAVDQTPASSTKVTVTLVISPNVDVAKIQSVVNAASLQPDISPGAMVSIFGSTLFRRTLSTTYDDTGFYPTTLAGTRVTFNGVAAPLLYVSPSQINAVVPLSVAGQGSVQVQIVGSNGGYPYTSYSSEPVTAALQDTAPAVFTSSQTGSGQAAILQQAPNGPLSYNSSVNPAHAGDYLEIFATGQGVWTPPPQSDINIGLGQSTTTPVSVSIGGQAAKVVYSGTMGGLNSWSVLQINAIVPSGLAAGSQPLVLTIGTHDNSLQKVVIYVQ